MNPMNHNKVLGLMIGASIMLGYGAIVQAAPSTGSQNAVISNSDVLILAAQKERGERQEGRQETRGERQGGRDERREQRR
jgi:hypothetical protein